MAHKRCNKPQGKPQHYMVTKPYINVLNENGVVTTQFLYGECIDLYENNIAQSQWDNYVGIISDGYGHIIAPTHFISVARSPIFADADLKSTHICSLSLNCQVAISRIMGKFSLCPLGWIYTPHLLDINSTVTNINPVGLAMTFLGTPYIWGGKTSQGIDCSGLVQMVFKACAIALGRDSDMQESINHTVISRQGLQQNDLVFWRGHVGIMIDDNRMIHANATDMCVSIGNLDRINSSIIKNDGGGITSMLRYIV